MQTVVEETRGISAAAQVVMKWLNQFFTSNREPAETQIDSHVLWMVTAPSTNHGHCVRK